MRDPGRKKLLVILGAGSSVDFGLPLVTELDGLMQEWGTEWSTANALADFFSVLWDSLGAHYATGSNPCPERNFERVMGEMIALAHWMTPAPYGNALKTLVAPAISLPPFVAASAAVAAGARSELAYLLIRLAQRIRSLSCKVDAGTSSFGRYKDVFDALREQFEVGIFNLNYDAVASCALPDAFMGFDKNGRFDPIAVHSRESWDFVYHLHGSVHHTLVGPMSDEIHWKEDLGGSFHDGHEGSSGVSHGHSGYFPRTTLVAGGFKPDQLLLEPFQSFYAAMVRHAYEADAILIGGYGFGDEHVNRALMNRMTRTGLTPPVMVLDWGSHRQDPIAFRTDPWSQAVAGLSLGRGEFFEPGTTSPLSPEDLKLRQSFEVSHDGRVAVWYGGFTAAAVRRAQIARWLAGAEDAELVT